jgi:hypothetical protein
MRASQAPARPARIRPAAPAWVTASQARPARARRRARPAAAIRSCRSAARCRSACRGDHAHHLALHRPLGGGHVAHLLADRHRLAQLDQARQVASTDGRARPPSDRLAGRLAARGQRDVQQAAALGIG